MTNISLPEAVELKVYFQKRIHKFKEEMDHVAFIKIEK